MLYCLLCFIIGGYLPFSFFQWTNLNGKASQRYISARCYTTNRLCHWFGGMNPELLPLCAVLTGNDYGTPKDAETLLALLDVGRGGGRGKGRVPTSRIEGILMWLSSFSNSAGALEEVSRLMGEQDFRARRGQKGGLTSQLWAGMQEYHLTPQSSLARWFSGDKAASGEWSSRLTQLPEGLSLAAAKGLLAPMVVDALVMRRVLLIPQVENSKLSSSHCSAKKIRQAVYGILLQGGQCGGGSGQLLSGQGGVLQAQNVTVQENFSQGVRGGRGRGGRARGSGHRGGGRGQGVISPTQQGGNVGLNIEQAAGGAAVHTQGSGAPVSVEEYDRADLNLKKNQEEAHLPRTPIHLDTLTQVNLTVKVSFISTIFVLQFF